MICKDFFLFSLVFDSPAHVNSPKLYPISCASIAFVGACKLKKAQQMRK